MAWVESNYLADPSARTPEIKAALLALSVHGNANGAIPRERVIQSYRLFMKEHPEIAGHVAPDLAAWQYWDAVPDYLALMKSDVRQSFRRGRDLRLFGAKPDRKPDQFRLSEVAPADQPTSADVLESRVAAT